MTASQLKASVALRTAEIIKHLEERDTMIRAITRLSPQQVAAVRASFRK